MDRGKIRNREQAQQIRDFSGLRWGTITPTDIDAFFEMDDILFVFIEIKFKDTQLPRGQRLGLERIINLIGEKRKAILILAKHETPSMVDIDAANCTVCSYYFRKTWHNEVLNRTLKDFCDWFIEYAKTIDMGAIS